ncbi:MAG: leucine-rich repeat protein, partial [Alphaproteobacteria bacterium]|nr:leucine-rich repeat protein [Alphaproteobacteria bacterium]
NLQNINIPDSVTYIGDRAFWGATALTDIIIPESVTSLGTEIFAGGVTATVYCHKDLNCSGQGTENIVTYDKQGGVYMIGDKYYTSLENMQNDISRASNDTTDYTCGTDLNACKRSVLESKGICQGEACDAFIQSDGNYMLKYQGKTYQSINDLLKGNYDRRRIYTVEEANFVAGERNTVTIRYR